MRYFYALVILLGLSTNIFAQNSGAITTAVPFLNISPDARSGAMGDAGVALSPDANAQYWNASKLAFLDKPTNFSLSYSPWLRNLVSDVSLANLDFSHKLDDRNTIGASLRYFNLGTLNMYDDDQNSLGTSKPNEYSFDASLARKFGENFSLGLTLRYIHSNIAQGAAISGQQITAANAVAADVSLFSSKTVREFGNDAVFAYGVDVSNIGPKVSYDNGNAQYFLPTNLRIGAANTWMLEDESKITFTMDLNKLLVPTPATDANGNYLSSTDNNKSIVSGIFGSFTDAPGGFSEEMQEINYSAGLEIWYHDVLALRTGYFYENPNKGNIHYATFGAGFKFTNLELDFSYLVSNQSQYNPLANTLRLSLGYNLDSVKPNK